MRCHAPDSRVLGLVASQELDKIKPESTVARWTIFGRARI
jgi:hypothetical protein